jgi:hypothetical protein
VDRNMDKLAKKARADGFAPMDLFHKRSNGAPENHRLQKIHVAARDGESDSDISSDARMRTKLQSQNNRKQSAARPDRKGNWDISSDSSLSESYLQKLSVDKGASATEKNGITAFDIDSDSDDSNMLQRTRPRNVLGSDKTASKEEPSALAIDSDIDSDVCFDSSAGGREKPRLTKMSFAANINTGPDMSSPASLGLSRHIYTRFSPKDTANQTKTSSIFSRKKESDLQGSRRLSLDDRHQADAQKHRVTTSAMRKSWEESSDNKSQSHGAGISPTRTKCRQPPTQVSSYRLEDSYSSESMLRESSARKVASRRNNGKKSLSRSKTPEAVVDLASSRKEKSTFRLFSPRDAGNHRIASVSSSGHMKSSRRRDPDSLSFPSSDDSLTGQQRIDGHAIKKNSDGRTGVKGRGSNTAKSPCANDTSGEVDSDLSIISSAPQPGCPGTSKRSLPQEVTNGSRVEAPDDRLEDDDRLEGAILSVVSSSAEKSSAIELTANECNASGRVEKRLHAPRERPVPFGSTLPVPDNVGWMKKGAQKPAAKIDAVPSASFGLSFTKHNVRKARPALVSKAVIVSSRHSSESPLPHTNGAIVPEKASEGSSSTYHVPKRSSFSRRNRLAKPNAGENLIDSDDGMEGNTQRLPRKRLFRSSERGKAAVLFPSTHGIPVVKHKDCSNHYGSKQKRRQF